MAQGTLLPKEILNPATAPRKGQHPGSAVPRVRLQCPVACPTPPELAKVTARGKALGLAWDHKFTRLSVWTRTSTDVTKLEVASDGSSLKYPAVRDVMINILCIYIYIPKGHHGSFADTLDLTPFAASCSKKLHSCLAMYCTSNGLLHDVHAHKRKTTECT